MSSPPKKTASRPSLAAWVSFALIVSLPVFADSPKAPTSLAYVLQANARASTATQAAKILANCGRDWIVIDTSFDGTTAWSRSNIATIRQGKADRKVIAYLSIGEAEDYRPYWKKDWINKNKPTALAPPWLGPVNPDWQGNYRVKYWQPGWQSIILAAANTIMAQGFDGLYLDIVDGFEFYEQDHNQFIDDRLNPATHQSYRRDMVDWVKTLATHIRTLNASAIIIPQNGVQLLENSDFLDTINAVGVEDLYTNGKKAQPAADTDYVLSFLADVTLASKPVFVVEYPTAKSKLRQTVRDKAHADGFIWLLTDRNLTTLGKSGN